MTKNILACTIIAYGTMLQGSSANLKKLPEELSKKELTTHARSVDTKMDLFKTQLENVEISIKSLESSLRSTVEISDVPPTLKRVNSDNLEDNPFVRQIGFNKAMENITKDIEHLKEKSKRDATDFLTLATQAFSKIEELKSSVNTLDKELRAEVDTLNAGFSNIEHKTNDIPAQIKTFEQRIAALEKFNTAQTEAETKQRKKIITVCKVITTLGVAGSVAYAAHKTETSHNVGNAFCAFVRGLIPSRVAPTLSETPPTNAA